MLATVDLAFASLREVEEIHIAKTRGLRWELPASPPPGLPRRPGLVFLDYDRADESDVLGEIRASKSLAIQFNSDEASIRPDGTITVEFEGDRHDLKFSLYVLRTSR